MACKSSLALYKTFSSFQSYQRTFRDLREETEALSVVLESLRETVANDSAVRGRMHFAGDSLGLNFTYLLIDSDI